MAKVGRSRVVPHKEIIEYKGEKIEVITFDTVVHLTKGKKHALKDIDKLLKEEQEYKRTSKLTKPKTT